MFLNKDRLLQMNRPLNSVIVEQFTRLLDTSSSRGRQYRFYGNNQVIQEKIFPAVILSGPADTGKTLAWLYRINQLCWQYPGIQVTLVRKVANDLPGTVVQTYLNKVITPSDGVEAYGGERRPARFIYPNGSVIWLAGLDKASKVLSSERDIIYVNQAEELTQVEWETLRTRASGRAGNAPFGMLCGDCNPASPLHWIRQLANRSFTFLESYHRDNPELYNPETGEITEMGKVRLAALESLTGSTRERLLHGLWVLPTGMIYEAFQDSVHKVAAFDPPRMWPRVVGIDPFGDRIAALWIAYDPQNQILNVYREYSEPFGLTTPRHVARILELSGYTSSLQPLPNAEVIAAWVGGGPSERQARLDWAAYGIPLLAPPVADVWAQIDRVIQLLNERRLVIHDSCTGLLTEIGEYRRKEVKGVVTDEIADKEKFHLLDCLRYACSWLLHEPEQSRIVYDPVRIIDY